MLKKKLLLLSCVLLLVVGAFAYESTKATNAYAVDPLIITYDGGPTNNPVFVVSNFLPGDTKQESVVVENGLTEGSFGVRMRGELTEETKNFADILDIVITEVGVGDIYGGTAGAKKLSQFLDEPNINLGVFVAGQEKTYVFSIHFPSESGNEYQNAKVVFDLIFSNFITIDLPPECAGLAGQIVNVVEGTEGPDNIHATHLGDLILAKGGNDKIRASSGSDCIVAGEGNDTIDAGTGNEVILGGGGDDDIKSGTDNDTVYGGEGNDKIDTGSGNDLVYGGNGNDTIEGGSDKDKLYGENGNDNIRGGSDNDILDGGANTDTLNGNSGTDTCSLGEIVSSCEI
jgi:Ca2+-binding RTX toxin-like protein